MRANINLIKYFSVGQNLIYNYKNYICLYRQFIKKFLYELINRYSKGRENIKDHNRSGKPVTSISDDKIQSVQTVMKKDN